MDVCYVDTESHVGSQLFVTFRDNCRRKLWASILKTRTKCCRFSRSSKREPRERHRPKMNAVQVYNGGEYQG